MIKVSRIIILTALFLSAVLLNGQSYLQKQDLIVNSDQIVDDVVLVDSSLVIRGQVYGTVYVVKSDVYITSSSAVKGDIVIIGGRLTINPQALIGSKLILIGTKVEVENMENGLQYLKNKYNVVYSEEVNDSEINFWFDPLILLQKSVLLPLPLPESHPRLSGHG